MPRFVCYAQPHDPEMLQLLIERLGQTDWAVQTEGPDARTDVLVTGYPSIEELAAAPNLRALVIPFAGLPPKTKDLLRDFPSISVHNLHHNAPETAETAMALLLACAKMVVPMDRALRSGDWTPRYDASLSIRLEGRTVVVVGYGAIGRRIGRACQALGMRVIGHRSKTVADQEVEIRGPDRFAESLAEADVLVLAVPHTAATTGMIGSEQISQMKLDAILINVARAGLVDEQALYEALRDRRLRAAGLDVWYRYPESDASKGYMGYVAVTDTARTTAPSSFPFHELDSVVMSPHRGGTSADVERARVEALAELLTSEPMPNCVDLDRGY